MSNNDALSFSATETVTPTSASEVSDGVTVQAQATRMGLVVICELTGADPLDGNYTVIVQTADENDLAGNTWSENSSDSVTFDSTGTYSIELTEPIFDKVRVLIENDAGNPDYATLTMAWLADTELTPNT